MFLALLLAASAALPKPGELKTFGDWIVGCDNGRACEARALVPEDVQAGWSVLELRRGAEATAQPSISLIVDDPGKSAALLAGARRIAVRADSQGGVAPPPEAVSEILQAARSEPDLKLVDLKGAVLSRISLKGAAAALLWLDEQQGRIGTTTALIRRGARPAASVPAPPALPVVTLAAGSAKPPTPLSAAAVKAAVGDNGCKKGDGQADQPPSYHRLDARHTLALVPLVCISGAYNIEIDAYVIADGHSGDPQPADYEAVFGDSQEGASPTDENTSWDEKTRRLTVGMKGRSFGDCGSWRDYGWDGRRFRLVAQKDMGECRYAQDFIPTWRSIVRER